MLSFEEQNNSMISEPVIILLVFIALNTPSSILIYVCSSEVENVSRICVKH